MYAKRKNILQVRVRFSKTVYFSWLLRIEVCVDCKNYGGKTSWPQTGCWITSQEADRSDEPIWYTHRHSIIWSYMYCENRWHVMLTKSNPYCVTWNVGDNLDDFLVKILGGLGYRGKQRRWERKRDQKKTDSRIDKIRDAGEAWKETRSYPLAEAVRWEVSLNLSVEAARRLVTVPRQNHLMPYRLPCYLVDNKNDTTSMS